MEELKRKETTKHGAVVDEQPVEMGDIKKPIEDDVIDAHAYSNHAMHDEDDGAQISPL